MTLCLRVKPGTRQQRPELLMVTLLCSSFHNCVTAVECCGWLTGLVLISYKNRALWYLTGMGIPPAQPAR